jgi:hypothetical protein
MRTALLLLLAACDGGPPRADFHLAPTPARVDVGDAPLELQFEATWTEEAGRRADGTTTGRSTGPSRSRGPDPARRARAQAQAQARVF